MKCIDITRELLGSPVYPGDPAPHMEELRRIRLGDECNVSALYACLHNGTHLDAPRHFMPDGQTIDELPLTACIGECSVVEGEGLLLGAQAEEMLPKLKKRQPPFLRYNVIFPTWPLGGRSAFYCDPSLLFQPQQQRIQCAFAQV